MQITEYGFKRVVEELKREQESTQEVLKEVTTHSVSSATLLASIDSRLKSNNEILLDILACLRALCSNGAIVQAETHRIVNGLKNGKFEV